MKEREKESEKEDREEHARTHGRQARHTRTQHAHFPSVFFHFIVLLHGGFVSVETCDAPREDASMDAWMSVCLPGCLSFPSLRSQSSSLLLYPRLLT